LRSSAYQAYEEEVIKSSEEQIKRDAGKSDNSASDSSASDGG